MINLLTDTKKAKGLMGLKFMQQALKREKQKNKEQAEEAIREIDELRGKF